MLKALRGSRVIQCCVGVVVLGLVLVAAVWSHQYFQNRGTVHASEKGLISTPVSNHASATHLLDSPNTKQGPVSSQGLQIAILMYHHVGIVPEHADALRHGLTVSIVDFESQVSWLKSNGYTSVTLHQAYLASQGQYLLPPKPVVFTFDDGYADVFQNAVPVLQKYAMVGSFAVVPGFLGKPDYATWDMVTAAKQSGMEIVSHTEDHFDGSNKKYDAAFIKSNLEQSLQELEAHVGPVPRILVYPYGHYTDMYITVAQQVGFYMALTTNFGKYVDPNSLMTTPRVRVHGGAPLEKFIENITGIKKQ